MAADVIEVQKLYVAYFGRPGDPSGINYWTDVLGDNAATLADVSASFAASQEYSGAYAGLDNRAIVTEVYDNLFGRAAESAGIDYWAGLMDRGLISVNDVVEHISEAANGNDSVVFNGKVAAASLFVARLDRPAELLAYSGDAAKDIAVEFLATVKDLSSAANALDPAVVDAYIERIVNLHGVGPGDVGLVGVAPVLESIPGA